MQYVKKYFSEGLIQFTILLSLIGVRVDVTLDTYLNGYYSPILETNIGQSSAYIQTPFHNLRDTLDGYSLHPKCPDLDSYFASRRLLNEVRALGSPRFPTQLSAWLVHVAPAESDSAGSHETQSSAAAFGNSAQTDNGTAEGCDSRASDGRGSRRDASPHSAEEDATRPCPNTETRELSKEDSRPLRNALHSPAIAAGDEDAQPGGATSHAGLTASQLAHSDALDEDFLSSDVALLSPPSSSLEPSSALRGSVERPWHDFLPLSVFDDLELDAPVQALDVDATVSMALSRDVSLQDALVRRGPVATEEQRVLRQESTNSSQSDSLLGAVAGLPLHDNGTRNGTSRGLSGYLDEAVFEQINLLGFGLDAVGMQPLDEPDSDSGLSLDSGSRTPDSPGSSEASSGELYGEDDGAVGYVGEAEWRRPQSPCPSALAECVRHNHTYGTPSRSNTQDTGSAEVASGGSEEAELSRDERHARALRIPFSASEIVSMPVERFLEVVGRRSLSPAQVSLLRDIRRRGKNKLAAQNCRKRKLDAISGLEGEVQRLGRQRDRLLRERAQHGKALCRLRRDTELLSRELLTRLRDERGRPVSPARYTLQCAADGHVLLLPRGGAPPLRPDAEKRSGDGKR